MTLLKVNPAQRKMLAIATILALLIGVWFLKHYIMLILFATLVVILFNPVYQWFLGRGRSPNKAAFYTFVISVLVVIIPLIFVTLITFYQIQHLVNGLTSGNYPQDITTLTNHVVTAVNGWLSDIGVSYRLSTDTIIHAISVGVQNFGKALIGGLLSSVAGFAGFITAAIIYIYVFISIITHQAKILDILRKLNPLGDTVSDLYFQRIGAMTKATVRGQFVIALCQGTISAAVLALVGFDNLFFFFWMLLTVLSVIPLGAGIVTIPMGIVMILLGNVWQGAVVILNHVLIVTNIDNVLRPRLVPRQARLDSALMILGVFAGLGLFGFFGVVLGPVLMIILVTTIQMYLEVFADTKAIDQSAERTKRRHGVLSKLQFWKTEA